MNLTTGSILSANTAGGIVGLDGGGGGGAVAPESVRNLGRWAAPAPAAGETWGSTVMLHVITFAAGLHMCWEMVHTCSTRGKDDEEDGPLHCDDDLQM